MKSVKLLLVFFAVIIIAWLAILFHLAGRTVDTAGKMADKTVFNADKHVWTYEEFRNKYQNFLQYKAQYESAKKSLEQLEEKGITSGQRYDNLVTEMTGAKNMMYRIAAAYNKMASVAYQKIWKGDLPNKLEVLE